MAHNNAYSVVRAWLDYANSGNVSAIVGLYAEDSVLLPTFSPHTLRTEEGRRNYFTVLASRKGFGVSLHEKTVHIQKAGGGIELITGIYRFQVDIDDEPLVFEARFSYVIDVNQARPILHHHSSQIPRTLN